MPESMTAQLISLQFTLKTLVAASPFTAGTDLVNAALAARFIEIVQTVLGVFGSANCSEPIFAAIAWLLVLFRTATICLRVDCSSAALDPPLRAVLAQSIRPARTAKRLELSRSAFSI